jgi:hypothetical protein
MGKGVSNMIFVTGFKMPDLVSKNRGCAHMARNENKCDLHELDIPPAFKNGNKLDADGRLAYRKSTDA